MPPSASSLPSLFSLCPCLTPFTLCPSGRLTYKVLVSEDPEDQGYVHCLTY